jgi:hypothetical protein
MMHVRLAGGILCSSLYYCATVKMYLTCEATPSFVGHSSFSVTAISA